jgi:hypothetical protein
MGGAGMGGAGMGGAGMGGAGMGGAGGVSGDGGGGPEPGCIRIDPLTWVRTRYATSTPHPITMQDGAVTITATRYSWVGWFEYDVPFASAGSYRVTIRTADDGWHEGQSDELYNHFSVRIGGVTCLDFDANTTPYDDGASAVGDLRFHDATGTPCTVNDGTQVVRFDNIADNWVSGDDMQLHIATIDVCRIGP